MCSRHRRVQSARRAAARWSAGGGSVAPCGWRRGRRNVRPPSRRSSPAPPGCRGLGMRVRLRGGVRVRVGLSLSQGLSLARSWLTGKEACRSGVEADASSPAISASSANLFSSSSGSPAAAPASGTRAGARVTTCSVPACSTGSPTVRVRVRAGFRVGVGVGLGLGLGLGLGSGSG